MPYLQPVEPIPINDRPLEDIFGEAIAAITGYPRNSVRPRIQPGPPNLLPQEEDWCAFGVAPVDQDTFAYVQNLPVLLGGSNRVERDEMLDVLISFYGANSHQFMSRLREGLSVDENRWALEDQGIKLQGMGSPVSVPSLLKDRYVRRIDLTFNFARRVAMVYAVRSIETAEVDLHTEVMPPVSITVTPPQP